MTYPCRVRLGGTRCTPQADHKRAIPGRPTRLARGDGVGQSWWMTRTMRSTISAARSGWSSNQVPR